MEADNEYVAYEPNKRIAFRTTSGPVRLEASYLFEPSAAGTRLTSRIEMDASGLVSLAEPLIAAGLKREMKAAFRSAEGSPGGSNVRDCHPPGNAVAPRAAREARCAAQTSAVQWRSASANLSHIN